MTKSAPFLSIVTISFNQIEYLRASIDSVLSQKSEDVEYIVVDPGSTDGSRELLYSYGDQIDHLILDPDDGPADGLNKGFARAAGEIGYFINSDDFLMPGAIQRLRKMWSTHADCDLLLAAGWMIDGANRPIRQLRPTRVSLNLLKKMQVVCVQQGMSFNLDKFRSVDGFNISNRTCWDYELLVDFVLADAKLAIEPDRLGAFRLHDASLSGGGHGAAHDARYEDDSKRIAGRLHHEGVIANAFAPPKHYRLGKFAANLDIALHQAFDTLIPNAMRRRWENDMKDRAIP